MKLIDIHAHLNFPQFDADREAVSVRAAAAGIGIINVGTDRAMSEGAVKLAEGRENVWATIGLHPTDWAEGFDLDYYRALGQSAKVVAIGECGLDYLRLKAESDKGRQKEIFEQQIELALGLDKPLMIHCRQAYPDVLATLRSHRAAAGERLRGNVHFFAGDWPTAQKFLDLGFTLSFTGVITFPPKADQPGADAHDVIRRAPLAMILAETDCPFVAPAPHRGRRNEPLYLTEIVKQIALVKNLAVDEVARATVANARRSFRLASLV